MPRRKSLVRSEALARHALTRRLERRERWLERGHITPEVFKQAVDTLVAALSATKVVPAVADRRGTIVERVEVPDHATRVKAAAELADLIRLTVGLTAEPTPDAKGPGSVFVFHVPAWLESIHQVPAINAAESVAVAALSDGEEVQS